MLTCGQNLKITVVVIFLLFVLGSVANAEPLNEAAKQGNLKEVKRLISKGANIEVKDASSATPSHGANVNAVNMNGRTPLYSAAFNGLVEIAEILIANGADVNAVDKGSRTPLTRAEEGGHKDVVKLLISHGAHK